MTTGQLNLPHIASEHPPGMIQVGEPFEQNSPQKKQERFSTCSECGKAFTHRSLLLIHRKLHTGNGSHLCLTCGNSFPGMWSFAKHLRSHPGLRPYKCEECGERFAKGSDLGAHRRTHQGSKRSQECGKWWKRLWLCQKSELHTREKLYKCGQCEKAFAQKSQLWLHKEELPRPRNGNPARTFGGGANLLPSGQSALEGKAPQELIAEGRGCLEEEEPAAPPLQLLTSALLFRLVPEDVPERLALYPLEEASRFGQGPLHPPFPRGVQRGGAPPLPAVAPRGAPGRSFGEVASRRKILYPSSFNIKNE
ncbi:hypothetical protein E2320_014394 [Naja naja]|nr:hypothetical protein E2320_014394 [Naja naja]